VKISIFALARGVVSLFSIIPLTPAHKHFIDFTLLLLFKIRILSLFLINDVTIFVENNPIFQLF